MGRDRRPPADPQWGRHLRGEGRCAHVALGRQPPDHARAAIEVLVRPGDPQAQGDRLGHAEPRPLFGELIRRGVITHVALNGSAAIHDFELAAYGGTSEDVAAGLADGTFGMVEETGREMNAAIADGARAGKGMGEALADYLARRPQLAARDVSLLLAAAERAVPVTVHATLGADIIHQHPAADGAALGATSHRDFKRLAGSLPAIHDGGVVLNVGSAVVMPEVFLKALTIARNLGGGKPTGFTACDCDMQRHYRPRVNVVERPTLASGRGIQLTGHHEILIPLLAWAVIRELDAR